MKFTVKVDGLKELDANLGQLSKATARNVLRRVLIKAGQPMADRMAELAPDDPSTGGRDLKRSIIVSPRLKNPVGNAEYSAALKGGESTAKAVSAMRDARRAAGGKGTYAEVYVGPESQIFYAHLVEFGVQPHYQPKRKAMHPGYAPRPFMRPAFDEMKHTVLRIVRDQLSIEIDKAISRMQRRAAKKAAAGK